MNLKDRNAWKQLVFAALVLVAIVAFFWFLWTIKGVILPLIFAAFLAYLLHPLVHRMQKAGLQRSIGALIALSVVILALTFMVFIPWPIISSQLNILQQKLPEVVAKLHYMLANSGLIQNFFPEMNSSNWLQQLQDFIADKVNFSKLGQDVWHYLMQGGSVLLSTLSWALLVPILTYFVLVSWPDHVKQWRQLLPKRWRAGFWRVSQEMDEVLSQYMRGQVLLMLSLAVYYAVLLKLIGLQVGIPVGILTGLFVIIPYLGFGLGFVLATLTALLQFGLTVPFFLVLAVYGIGQLLESYVLTPRLVGERIGLSPVGVILALLIFGTLFGFVGMLFALPVSAVLVVVTRLVRDAYFNSAFYLAEPAPTVAVTVLPDAAEQSVTEQGVTERSATEPNMSEKQG